MAKSSKTLHAARDKIFQWRDAGRAVWGKSFGAKARGERDGVSIDQRNSAGAAQTEERQAANDVADLLDRQTRTPQLAERLDDIPDENLAQINNAARTAAPVVWLLGKVQSGKSSIVQALSGCSDAQIGEGFRACTTTARIFDFPAAVPMIRFLDTRGLGEAAYDPGEDIATFAEQTQLLLVVLKALDPQQGAIIELVQRLRRDHPDWPIVVAQTSLHDAYQPGQDHVMPYPYGIDGSVRGDDQNAAAAATNANAGGLGKSRNLDLERALHYQRQLFDAIPGDGAILFVPLDFTQPQDGFEPRFYGLSAMLDAMGEAAPAALAKMLKDASSERNNRFGAAAHPHILGYAGAAAAADLVPIAGLVAVPGVQAKLLHSLAGIYGAQWSRRLGLEFSAQLGAGIALRLAAGLGLRELAKLVPGYGQTIGTAGAAATSFITTYALGRAACVFLAAKQTGVDDTDGVAQAYRDGLARALELVKDRSFAAPSSSSSQSSPGSTSSTNSSSSPAMASTDKSRPEQAGASNDKTHGVNARGVNARGVKTRSGPCDSKQKQERLER